ncbi:MAG TPA: long-chain fatty acid--CoA ligase [Alphaproteobacteria bacterium]|nr:long-chain fatty acid--CoA ligase [Alphaproteobacteria bacterium]
MNIADWIDRHAAYAPGKAAILFENREVTYAALAQEIERLAGALVHDLGVAAGDRVAILAYNRPEFLTLVFACARIGAICVPLNWRLAPPEHSYILQDAEAAVLLCDAPFREGVVAIRAELPLRALVGFGFSGEGWRDYASLLQAGRMSERRGRLEDPLLIVYTSGTTGRPKGAVLTQNALQWNAINSTALHDLVSTDRVLTFLPMFHVGGLNIQTLPALHAGATVILQPRFQPAETLQAIARRRPSITLVVPAVMSALIADPAWRTTDISCLRLVGAGSSIIPLDLIRAFHVRGVPVCQVYGSTETAPIAIVLRREDAMRKEGSTGTAALHCEVRIVDDQGRDVAPGVRGEIVVRGHNVMTGYWRDPAATAEALVDGWFHTGDIGHQDEEGFFWVDERKKDLIISGGENIYPAELEAVLTECREVAEAAVVARPDPKWGEVPVAVVVRRPGTRLAADQVRALFAGRLARFKHPHDVIFVDNLPRNVIGKVLRYRLRELVRDRRSDT